MAGNFLFAGHLVENKDASLWGLGLKNPRYLEELHGYAWLDDLAAVGDGPAREKAQAWTWEWMVK